MVMGTLGSSSSRIIIVHKSMNMVLELCHPPIILATQVRLVKYSNLIWS